MTDYDNQAFAAAEAESKADSRRDSYKERAFNQRRKAEKDAVTWPYLKPGNSVLPAHCLRALVFGLSAKTAAKAQPIRQVPAVDDVTDTSRGASVKYYGSALVQADLRVLLGLVARAAGRHISEHVEFDAVEFLSSIGRATCSRSVAALEVSIVKLMSATFHVKDFSRDTGRTFGLVERSERDEFRVGHQFKIRLAPGLRDAIDWFHEIYVDTATRNKLKDGVQTALADLLRATTAESYDLPALADMWGREDARELGREVREALAKLVEVGILVNWSATRGRVHVVRA